MRIVIVNENVALGGVDHFISSLLKNWPNKDDQISLIINDNHPGLLELKTMLPSVIKVIEYRGPFVWDFPRVISESTFARRLFVMIFQYYYFFIHFLKMRRLLSQLEYDCLFVVNGGYPGGDLCRAATLASTKPVVFNFHNLAVKPRVLKKIPETIIDYLVSKKASVLIAVSWACLESLKLRMRFSGKEVVIYNGVDASEELPHLMKSKDQLFCGMVGLLEPRKGHIFVLEAFKEVVKLVPSAHLKIFGDGKSKFKAEIVKKVQDLELGNYVTFVGYVKDKNQIFDDMAILVVPSQEFESFGLVAAEAMMRGIPVVCSDVGGLPEVVKNGSSGYVVPKTDVSGFAQKIILLLTNSQKRAKMGKASKSRAMALFRAEGMAEEYRREIYKAVGEV